MNPYLKNPIFKIISGVSEELKTPAFVIGGFVRDCVMGREMKKDIDIVVKGSGIDFAMKVAEAAGSNVPVKYFRNFGTAMMMYKDVRIEFVGARKESYHRDSRKPVVEDGTLEDDQNRRDFTINAMAFSLEKNRFGELIDPFNGSSDIEKRIIRTPLDPGVTFSDDPLRMMRAIRFASQLGFTIDPVCYEAIKQNAARISIVSKERITDELNLIIESGIPSEGMEMLADTGLMQLIFPELMALKGIENIGGMGHKDNFNHTLEVLDNVALRSDSLWLRWAAILHDIAKPVTKKFVPGTGWTFYAHDFRGAKMVPVIFRNLRLPLNEKMKYVEKLVLLHLRPIAITEEVTDSAIRRLLFDAGETIDDLMLLCEADITSKNPVKVKRFLERFENVRKKLKEIEEKDRLRNWQPPISGEIIMKTFRIPPSKEVGIIKSAITEAILEGEIPNEQEAAYHYMLAEGKKLGLTPGES